MFAEWENLWWSSTGNMHQKRAEILQNCVGEAITATQNSIELLGTS